MSLKYFSVCSGIEAATVAWEPLGFQAIAFSEIEPFPCAVLANHYPDVPNLGDMTRIDGKSYRGKVDILVGGTPCQAYSLAGRRLGLADERGQLALKFTELADDIDPSVVLWENVPGVLSSKDNAFGFFLAGLAGETVPLEPSGGKWTDAGFVLGPKRAVAWRCLDAQYFGLAQRRKRCFVVAGSPERIDPLQILFEFDGVRRDSPPSREAGQASSCSPAGIAGAVSRKWAKGSGGPAGDELYNLVVVPKDNHNSHWNGGPHPTLNRFFSGTSNQELFHQGGSGLVSGKAVFPLDLREIRRDEAKRGRLLGVGEDDAPAYTLTKSHTHGVAVCGDVAPTVSASGPPYSRTGNSRVESDALVCMEEAVRRLTPLEVERLQGFPDNHTLVPFRGKPASDSARYMALGNSMAVNVMRWLGERIQRELEKHASKYQS